MSPRVRLVGATIALDVVTDDGDTLTPVPVHPIRLSATEAEAIDVTAMVTQIANEIGAGQQEDDA